MVLTRNVPCLAVLQPAADRLLSRLSRRFSARAMQIHIKKLDGQKEEFSLEPSDSVMKVKVRKKRRIACCSEPQSRAREED